MRVVLVFGAVAVALITTLSALARPAPSVEYRIKAVFLFNFVQFVEWPASAFANDDAPLVLCVLGADPFGETLDQTIAGESSQRHRLVVRRPSENVNLDGCHLLFVSRSENSRLDEVLPALGVSAPVLIVSDIDGFVSRGGTIGFYLDRNRVRFEISPSHAQRRGLKVSSQLLGLGRILESNPKGGAP
jgi:YfiR/HmsC-like